MSEVELLPGVLYNWCETSKEKSLTGLKINVLDFNFNFYSSPLPVIWKEGTQGKACLNRSFILAHGISCYLMLNDVFDIIYVGFSANTQERLEWFNKKHKMLNLKQPIVKFIGVSYFETERKAREAEKALILKFNPINNNKNAKMVLEYHTTPQNHLPQLKELINSNQPRNT